MTKPQLRIPVPFTIVVVLTIAIVLGQAFGHPSDVQDIVTGEFNKGIRLHYPLTYVLFAPLFQNDDHLTILSAKQHIAFGSWVNLIWIWDPLGLCQWVIRRKAQPAAETSSPS